MDTLTGLKTLATDFPGIPIVVWLNLFFGDIMLNGKSFDQMKVYKEHSQQFQSIIEIPNLKKETFGRDLEELFANRQSFQAALNSIRPIMVRQRLKTFWNKTLDAINTANLIN